MLENTLRIGTFNMGRSRECFLDVCRTDDKEFQKRVATTECGGTRKEQLDAVVRQEEERAAEAVAEQVDVLCLQRCDAIDRPFVTKLTELGFTVTMLFNGANDTAIATRVEGLDVVERLHKTVEHRSCSLDLSSVVVRLKSGKEVAVTSMHTRGYGLGEKGGSVTSRVFYKQVRAFVAGSDANAAIIAGDMNYTPEQDAQVFNDYRAAGYRVMRSGEQAKNLEMDPSFRGKCRESDFMFLQEVRSIWYGLYMGLMPFFTKVTTVTGGEAKVADGFEFKWNQVCEARVPLVATFTEVEAVGSKAYLAALVLLVAAVGASAVWAIRR